MILKANAWLLFGLRNAVTESLVVPYFKTIISLHCIQVHASVAKLAKIDTNNEYDLHGFPSTQGLVVWIVVTVLFVTLGRRLGRISMRSWIMHDSTQRRSFLLLISIHVTTNAPVQ